MKKVIIGALALSTILIFSVSCKKVENKAVEIVNSMDSVGNTLENVAGDEMGLDMTDATMHYFGIYEGTIPAASGPGIAMTLTLNADYSFTLISKYLGDKGQTFSDQGIYTAEKGIITLKLEDGTTKYFKIGQQELMMLNDEMKPAEGDMAKNYILKEIKEFPQPEAIN